MTNQDVPPAIIKTGLHYQVPVEGLDPEDTHLASVWTDAESEVAEQNAALHDRLAAAYRLLASKLATDQRDKLLEARDAVLTEYGLTGQQKGDLPGGVLRMADDIAKSPAPRQHTAAGIGHHVTPEQLAKLNPEAVLRSTAGRLYVQCTDGNHLRQTEEGTYTHAEVLEREHELILLWEPA